MKINSYIWSLLISCGLYLLSFPSFSQPNVWWDKTIGGSNNDIVISTTPTPDGGYLLAGYSDSPVSGDKSGISKGDWDYWVVKIDGNGNKVWDKTYGGEANDMVSIITPTPDGGYLLAGHSESGSSGDKSENSKGGYDFWVVKIDGIGNKVWDKTIGGSNNDNLRSTTHTPDGGYLLAGNSASPASGDKSENNKDIFVHGGERDYWVVKIDSSGNKIWDKTYGGNGRDELNSTNPTPDGGFLLAGTSESPASGDKTEDNKGWVDYWIIKIDGSGNKVWDKTFGGSNTNNLASTTSTPDGGYLLAGHSDSPASGDKSENRKGQDDYWIVKIDGSGNKVWDKTIGGNSEDFLYSISPTPDGGYLLAGSSTSDATEDKSEDSKAGFNYWDYWVVKVDSGGNKVWDKTIGGSEDDFLYSTTPASDGGYLLAGYSWSNATGDKSEDSKGALDYWVVKLLEDTVAPVIETITPISANNDTGTCAASVAFSATVTDNYDASVSPVFSILLDGVSTEISSPHTFPIGETMVYVNATDASDNEADEQTFTVTVTNTVPVITGSLTAPGGPNPVGTPVAIYDEVRDNNIDSAVWHWSDGLVSPATLFFDPSTETYLVRGERTFDQPGTYTVELRVADLCRGTAAQAYPQLFTVNGSVRGMAIGGGSIFSPKGAYTTDASLTGTARFFFSFHNHYGNSPSGTVLFRFGRANLNFWSSDLEWMSVEGPSVQLRGEGRINGRGRYGFFLSLLDGAPRDRFRIKIWDQYSGLVVYDNEAGSPDEAEPGRGLAWGGIAVYPRFSGPGYRVGIPGIEAAYPQREIGELSDSRIRVYPNPVGEVLYIDMESDYTETVSLSIYDMAGRTLHEESRTIHKGPNRIVMDAGSWNAHTQQLLFRLRSPSTGFHQQILLKP